MLINSPLPLFSTTKFSPPTTEHTYQRQRLHKRLDAALHRSAVWIEALPGSGKSTLVAEHLRQQPCPFLWYRMDEGDDDPATFFHLFASAVRRLVGESIPLPQLTPEYSLGSHAFTRNFVRAIARHIQGTFYLVFDNYELLPLSSPVQELIPVFLEELPGLCRVIFVSRRPVVPAFAKLQVQRQMSLISPQELSLTAEESLGVISLLNPTLDIASASELADRCGGWLAGIILLLDTSAHVLPFPRSMATPQTVFDYLSIEVARRFTPDQLSFLSKAALLAEIELGIATAISDNVDGALLLEQLSQQHYFVERVESHHTVYRYHALFREFLLAELPRRFDVAALRALQATVAHTLQGLGQHELAADLFIACEHWPEAIENISALANNMLIQGRQRTLQRWLDFIPPVIVATHPWLSFWRGQCLLPYHPNEARGELQRAFIVFRDNKDIPGIYLSWCSVVQTFLANWHELHKLEAWVRETDNLLERYPVPEGAIRLQFTQSMISALSVVNPADPALVPWLRDAGLLLYREPEAVNRASLLCAQMWHFLTAGTINRQTNLLDTLNRLIDDDNVVPMHRLNLMVLKGYTLLITGNLAGCRVLAEQGLALANHSGVWLFNGMFFANAAAVDMLEGKYDRARSHLIELGKIAHYSDVLAVWHGVFTAQWHIMQREYEQALTILWSVYAIAEKYNHLYVYASVNVHIAMIYALQGNEADALSRLDLARPYLDQLKNPLVSHWFHAVSAWLAWRQKRYDDCKVELTNSLRMWKGFEANCIWLTDNIKSDICAMALHLDIETITAREMISRLKLIPRGGCELSIKWPWPVRIHTLGGFRIEFFGRVIDLTAQGIKKPFDLLKFLITLTNRPVTTSYVCAGLWPDKEGDRARASFDTALHRLRRFFDDEMFIQLRDGVLQLDTTRCFIDAWAVLELLEEAQRKMRRMEDLPDLLETFNSIVTLYRGEFLLGEEDHGWVYAFQTGLHQRIVAIIIRIAHHFEREGKTTWVDFCYEELARIDPSAVDHAGREQGVG